MCKSIALKNSFIIIFISIIYVLQPSLVKGQENRLLRFEIGGGGQYYYGQPDKAFDNFKNSYLNYQINSSLGIALGKNAKTSTLSAFGQMNFINAQTMSSLLTDQSYLNTNTINEASINPAYVVEGGLRLAGILRLSTGVGRQYFEKRTLLNQKNNQTININYLNFYSSTVGLLIGGEKVNFYLDTSFLYGKDFNHTVIIPHLGLSFQI